MLTGRARPVHCYPFPRNLKATLVMMHYACNNWSHSPNNNNASTTSSSEGSGELTMLNNVPKFNMQVRNKINCTSNALAHVYRNVECKKWDIKTYSNQVTMIKSCGMICALAHANGAVSLIDLSTNDILVQELQVFNTSDDQDEMQDQDDIDSKGKNRYNSDNFKYTITGMELVHDEVVQAAKLKEKTITMMADDQQQSQQFQVLSAYRLYVYGNEKKNGNNSNNSTSSKLTCYSIVDYRRVNNNNINNNQFTSINSVLQSSSPASFSVKVEPMNDLPIVKLFNNSSNDNNNSNNNSNNSNNNSNYNGILISSMSISDCSSYSYCQHKYFLFIKTRLPQQALIIVDSLGNICAILVHYNTTNSNSNNNSSNSNSNNNCYHPCFANNYMDKIVPIPDLFLNFNNNNTSDIIESGHENIKVINVNKNKKQQILVFEIRYWSAQHNTMVRKALLFQLTGGSTTSSNSKQQYNNNTSAFTMGLQQQVVPSSILVVHLNNSNVDVADRTPIVARPFLDKLEFSESGRYCMFSYSYYYCITSGCFTYEDHADIAPDEDNDEDDSSSLPVKDRHIKSYMAMGTGAYPAMFENYWYSSYNYKDLEFQVNNRQLALFSVDNVTEMMYRRSHKTLEHDEIPDDLEDFAKDHKKYSQYKTS